MTALPDDCPGTKPNEKTHNLIGFIKTKETRECLAQDAAGTFTILTKTAATGNGVRGTIVSSETSQVTVGGVSATRIEGIYAPSSDPTGQLKFVSITFQKGSTFYLINYHGDSQGTDLAAFDSFISTFTFTK